MLEYFTLYYDTYGIVLAIATIIMTISYLFIANWYTIRATYKCTNLRNTVTGKLGKCFDSVQGTTCQNTDLGHIYGWCNDSDNYGAMPGTKSGPYSGYCTQWIWSNDKCPPTQCMGDFPNGIGKQSETSCKQTWGWCADKGVNRSMTGGPCGPVEGRCDDWIWEVKKCPTACKGRRCPTSKKRPKNSCICNGPPLNQWKQYDNKNIRIRTKKNDCQLGTAGKSGGAPGIGNNEKIARFDCKADAKADVLLLEKSRDSNYRLINADGCTLKWSQRKGGSDSLGTEERIAKFDCGDDAGDPLILEGSPDNAGIYATIKGKKCGLQWASVGGNASHISRHERIAKFDCHDKADKLIVDAA
jgi:hypothetical protein